MAPPSFEDTDPTPPAAPAGLSARDRWLARFALSFVIVGVVLAWQGFHAFQKDATGWRGCVEIFAAAASFALGAMGIRTRHRRATEETGNVTK